MLNHLIDQELSLTVAVEWIEGSGFLSAVAFARRCEENSKRASQILFWH